jgi:hypothetical protein
VLQTSFTLALSLQERPGFLAHPLMASEIPKTQPPSMAIAAPGQPARSVDPVPETESNNALTQGSLSAENAEVPVGASVLSENASHGEDVDEEILSPSQVESHETQVNPNWTPTVYGEVIPPIALSEIGSIVDGHQPSGEGLLPSALFVLPFPAPLNAHRGKNTPPFLM